MMRITIAIAVAFLITISFWMGRRHERKSAPDCSYLQQQVDILETKNSGLEWYILDEKRKNLAFQEVIEMEMKR